MKAGEAGVETTVSPSRLERWNHCVPWDAYIFPSSINASPRLSTRMGDLAPGDPASRISSGIFLPEDLSEIT